MTHLLVTNDFPPKIGGIQSYLFELWRRLPPESFAVLTHREEGSGSFDTAAGFRIDRLEVPMLVPTPALRHEIERRAAALDATLVILDPALPLGLIGPHLTRPYGVVLHGAEVAIPAALPVGRALLSRVIAKTSLVIAAGGYPRGIAQSVRVVLPPTVVVPPGVDPQRFVPLEPDERAAIRRSFGLPSDGRLVLSVSRLVPRKGMDVLIESAARLAPERPDLMVAIGGTGRDAPRLTALAERLGAPVRFLGRVPEERLAGLTAAADVIAMLCRNRWLGLEQEGFGIVFLEAASAGVPQLAGLSGGSDEAVLDGVTGLVVDRPADVVAASAALARLIDDPELRERFSKASRARVLEDFDYAIVAERLRAAIVAAGG